MKLSARNQLKGTVKRVQHGVINSEILIEIAPEVEIVSIITKHSAEDLALVEGQEVVAVIKASNVMVGAD